MKRLARRLALGLLLLLVAGEGLAQLSGAVDFPLYRADAQIGYLPAPNQEGNFFHRNHFQFNEYSMAAGPFQPDRGRFNLLLVGDSIVFGGNTFAQEDRLGPNLARRTGWTVWPAAAGSWALQNELAYLERYPQAVEAVDAVAIVSNSGDFDEPSSWASELTHPTHRPFPAALYLLQKYVLHPAPPPPPPATRVVRRDWAQDLHRFVAKTTKPLFIILYPDREEMLEPAVLASRLYAHRPELEAAVGSRATILTVADAPEWNTSLYGDIVHPSEEGDRVLAEILARGIDAQIKSVRAQ